MVIGICNFALHLPVIHSLKEKRSVIKPLIGRIRQRYNVSVAETGNQDKWQLADIAVVCVSGDSMHAHRLLEQVISFIEGDSNLLIINVSLEII